MVDWVRTIVACSIAPRVLARAKIPSNTNEITIAPNLLSMFNRKDTIVTGDAMPISSILLLKSY